MDTNERDMASKGPLILDDPPLAFVHPTAGSTLDGRINETKCKAELIDKADQDYHDRVMLIAEYLHFFTSLVITIDCMISLMYLFSEWGFTLYVMRKVIIVLCTCIAFKGLLKMCFNCFKSVATEGHNTVFNWIRIVSASSLLAVIISGTVGTDPTTLFIKILILNKVTSRFPVMCKKITYPAMMLCVLLYTVYMHYSINQAICAGVPAGVFCLMLDAICAQYFTVLVRKYMYISLEVILYNVIICLLVENGSSPC